MVGLGLYAIQNWEVKEWQVKCWWFSWAKLQKTTETLFLLAVYSNNQPVSHLIGGTNNWKFYLNEVGISLVSGKVCVNALPSIVPIVVRTLDFCGNPALGYHKNIVNVYPLTCLHKNLLVL